MAYARRTTKRRISSTRYRPAARRSYTASRSKRKTTRKRASPAGGRTIRLVIEHMQSGEVQRPQLLMSNADRSDKNKKKTF